MAVQIKVTTQRTRRAGWLFSRRLHVLIQQRLFDEETGHWCTVLDLSGGKGTSGCMVKRVLDPSTLGEIIEMALSDHCSFDQIRALHGLGPDEVKALMRQNLKPGSYRAWRRRVRAFADRRAVYK